MTLADALDLITRGGATAVLILVVWAFYTDRIVTRETHKRALEERDEFRAEWAATLRLLDRSTTVSDKALDHGSRLQAQRQVRAGRRAEGADDVR